MLCARLSAGILHSDWSGGVYILLEIEHCYVPCEKIPGNPNAALRDYLEYLRILLQTLVENTQYVQVNHYCRCFLRKPGNLPFPFSVRLHAAFGSLSSPECIRNRAVCVQSNQGVTPEQSWSDSGAIWEHTLIARAAP